jgi:hypothetical protein
MSSRGSRRQIRPLTIYGFRRSRPKRHLWLLLIALGTLTGLPRLLSPIAEKLMGDSKVAAPERTTPESLRTEPGSAFAASESATPKPPALLLSEASRPAVMESTVTAPDLTHVPPQAKPERVPQSRRRIAVEPPPRRVEVPAKAEAVPPAPVRRNGRLVPAPR